MSKLSKKVVKKVAKRLFETGQISKKYVLGIDKWYNSQAWISELIVPGRIRREVYRLGPQYGWDGYWADSPLILSIEERV